MTFQSWPIAAVAAAIAIPALVILYLLKLRRRELEVSSTLLWKKAIQDLQANAPFQRLRRNLLLLIQLLILIAMLLAVAQPQQRTTADPGNTNIILIDRSASMSALDAVDSAGRPITRLERAKLDALAFVSSLSAGGILSGGRADQAMVIAFDRAAEIIQPMTDSRPLLEQAIRSITPSDATTNIDEALRIAASLARETTTEQEGEPRVVWTPGPPIHIYSDGGIGAIGNLRLHPDTPVFFTSIGPGPDSPRPNVGIVAMRAERSFDRPGETSIFVGLQSTDREPRSVDVQLEIDGVVTGVRAIAMRAADDIAPATDGVVFRINRTERALLTARVISDDALAADNVARLILPPARRLNVALVTTGAFFIREALEGLPLSRFETITPDQFTALAASGDAAQFDVIILDAWAPDQSTGSARALPPGRYIALGSLPPIRGLEGAPTPDDRKPAVITSWNREHPALRYAGLDALAITRTALSIAPTESVRVIATSSTGPAIVEIATPDTDAIVTAFKPGESNWPFDQGFVLFLATAIRSLGEDATAAAGASAEPGSTLTARLPEGIDRATLLLPDDSTVTLLPSEDGRVSFGPVRTAGLYTLSWRGRPGPQDFELPSGAAGRILTVNMLDPAESAIVARAELDLPAGTVQAANAQAEAGVPKTRRLWPWLVGLAIAVMMAEWFIYHRRVQL